ncbi:MAG: immunoglobulin domain-containing protein, partial [Verrucomicrobiota bacterium]
MNRRFVSCFFTCLLLVCGLVQFHSVSGQSIFVIEAEDFNYGSGQRRSQADTMPYLGGAYNGLGAVANVDYFQPANEGSANEYRVGETPNVPMTQNPDFDREAWQVTTNYRIGWTDNGDWYNYTRVFPNAHYQVYAALSFDGTAPGQLKGSMQKVTSGANTTSQTVVQLGTFDAPGSGGWGRNALVPLKSADGTIADVELNGLTTLRFTAVSGDIDYYKFVPLVPPQITEHPANLTVMEGEPATFSVKVSNTGPMSYQWQSNRVNIAGATSSVYTIPVTPLAADGAKYRCVLTNSLGTATSDEALLSVNPDSIKPAIANVQNIGTTNLMVVFSEPVEATTATASANYQISNGISVSAVAFGSDTRTVLLTTSALVYGTTYSLTVNNVKDRAVTPNTIVPNSTRTFLAVEYAPVEIGNPAQPGTVEPVPGGFNVTGGGLDIGGTSDQFHFEYQLRTGNFDVKVRLQSFSPSDMWAKAGLMARTSLTPNSAFAAALATPATVGCFFESRVSSGGNATLAGTFPVNYPETWLRLQRSGSTFTGYASLDGQNWTQLGSVSISMPNTIYFGPVVSSHHASTTARVEFRDIAPNIGGTVGNFTPNREPLGPSSRRTGLVISEIMYHPKDR